MREFLIAVLSGILGAGCAAETSAPSPDLYGDARFTLTERAEIERGAAWLFEHAGRPAPRFDWSRDFGVQDAVPAAIVRERAGATGWCTTRDGSGAVYLDVDGEASTNESPVGEHLAGLAAHELAHCALGFEDGYHAGDTASDGIMRVLTPMRWSASEEAQCARVGARCPASLKP